MSQKNKYFYGFSLIVALTIVVGLSAFKLFSKSDNSAIQTKTFGDLTVAIKYCSPYELAQKQMDDSEGDTDYSYSELVDEYAKSSDFVLRIENNNGGPIMKSLGNDASKYQELVQYFSFGIQNDLELIAGKDTLDCAFIHFERNYDLAPFAYIKFGFNTDRLFTQANDLEEWSVRFNAERLGVGPLYFNYQSN